ncbi:Crp/Fnr family transcriptional regulator [Kineobactrum salinum]|uniref:Crp/Fnr family transcriptional regulator n=1 Tax=Kineobactrum salinum TaxID=2708301 RepID=A0A6C0U4Q7_9GAMM|nr:Crp/Fnr family transcriptional regulator [Kineobactrum salinum]QIB64434.1 Crp/Fnr family transcriptional regulator [Kineobactrum salinum]
MLKVQGLHGWIDSLPAREKTAVRARMKQRHCEGGQAIYLAGEEGRELFQVGSGKVRFCTYALNGKEVQIGEIRAGDCFGELSLINGFYRANCAFSVGETELFVLNKRDFLQLYEAYPSIARELNSFLARRLQVAYTIIEDANLLPLRDRLIRLLSRLVFSVSDASARHQATVDGITHEQLANMLGATRQAVTRELKLLERAGLITSNYGRIVIESMSELVARSDQLVGSEPIVPDYSG